MSKEKGGKNVKKAPGTGSKKTLSDYQHNERREYYPKCQGISEVKAAMNRTDAAFTRLGNLDPKTSEMQFLMAYNNNRAKR